MNWPTDGTYRIDPSKSLVKVFTYKVPGLIAAMAHDLELHTRAIEGEVTVEGDEARVEGKVDLWTLKVAEPLTGFQKSEAEKTMQKKVLKKKDKARAEFSGAARKDGDATVAVDLSLIGSNPRKAEFDVSVSDVSEDGFTVHFKTQLKQTDFGIKPYKAMMGALKLKDELDIEMELHLLSA